MIVWQLWNHRNNIVWRDDSVTAAQVVYRAVSFHVEWRDARSPAQHKELNNPCWKWHRPAANSFKINVDTTVFVDSMQSGIGMVIRDDAGSFIA